MNYPTTQAAAAASQMYGYYMGGYQPVYGLPLQYGGIPATPGQHILVKLRHQLYQQSNHNKSRSLQLLK